MVQARLLSDLESEKERSGERISLNYSKFSVFNNKAFSKFRIFGREERIKKFIIKLWESFLEQQIVTVENEDCKLFWEIMDLETSLSIDKTTCDQWEYSTENITLENILSELFRSRNDIIEINVYRACVLRSFLNKKKIPPTEIFRLISADLERNLSADIEERQTTDTYIEKEEFTALYLNTFVEMAESYIITTGMFQPPSFCSNFFNTSIRISNSVLEFGMLNFTLQKMISIGIFCKIITGDDIKRLLLSDLPEKHNIILQMAQSIATKAIFNTKEAKKAYLLKNERGFSDHKITNRDYISNNRLPDKVAESQSKNTNANGISYLSDISIDDRNDISYLSDRSIDDKNDVSYLLDRSIDDKNPIFKNRSTTYVNVSEDLKVLEMKYNSGITKNATTPNSISENSNGSELNKNYEITKNATPNSISKNSNGSELNINSGSTKNATTPNSISENSNGPKLNENYEITKNATPNSVSKNSVDSELNINYETIKDAVTYKDTSEDSHGIESSRKHEISKDATISDSAKRDSVEPEIKTMPRNTIESHNKIQNAVSVDDVLRNNKSIDLDEEIHSSEIIHAFLVTVFCSNIMNNIEPNLLVRIIEETRLLFNDNLIKTVFKRNYSKKHSFDMLNVLKVISLQRIVKSPIEYLEYFLKILKSQFNCGFHTFKSKTLELFAVFIIKNKFKPECYKFLKKDPPAYKKFLMVFFRRLPIDKNTFDHIQDFFDCFLKDRNLILIDVFNVLPFISKEHHNLSRIYESIHNIMCQNNCFKNGYNSSFENLMFPFLLRMPAISYKNNHCLISHAERLKLQNFNFSGILEYLQDENTLDNIHIRDAFHYIHDKICLRQNFKEIYFRNIFEFSLKNEYKTADKLIILIFSHLLDESLYDLQELEFEDTQLSERYHLENNHRSVESIYRANSDIGSIRSVFRERHNFLDKKFIEIDPLEIDDVLSKKLTNMSQLYTFELHSHFQRLISREPQYISIYSRILLTLRFQVPYLYHFIVCHSKYPVFFNFNFRSSISNHVTISDEIIKFIMGFPDNFTREPEKSESLITFFSRGSQFHKNSENPPSYDEYLEKITELNSKMRFETFVDDPGAQIDDFNIHNTNEHPESDKKKLSEEISSSIDYTSHYKRDTSQNKELDSLSICDSKSELVSATNHHSSGNLKSASILLSQFDSANQSQEIFQSSTHHVNFDFFIDLIYINLDNSKMIRSALNFLTFCIKNDFSYNLLYVILKIHNMLGIHEPLVDEILDQSIRHVDFTIDCYKELGDVSTGFYKHFFYSCYNCVSNKTVQNQMSYQIIPEEKKEFFYNTFYLIDTLDIPDKFLENYNVYKGYILNKNNLLDICISINFSSRINLNCVKLIKDIDQFFVPQIVQLLRKTEYFYDIHDQILNISSKDPHIAMQFILNISSNFLNDKKIDLLVERIKKSSDFSDSLNFIDSLTAISKKMMKYKTTSTEMQKFHLNRYLKEVKIGEKVFSPLDGTKILRIIENSGKPLQSHAKFPYLVSFEVEKNGEIFESQIIFKAGDDCRQDQMALQIKETFFKIFIDSNLPIFLYPYKVISTSYGCGIIEVIPNAISRHQIGKEKSLNLVEYFTHAFGFKESKMYIEAKKHFVNSFVGYSLLSYILNLKDRHNANIMINHKGQVIHIDFGFMFEIAPGGIPLEIPIKITEEVYNLLREHFDEFEELMIQGFFALRRRSKEIVLIAASFRNSGLPCFSKYSIDNLIERFRFDLSDEEIKVFMRNLVQTSIKKIRTYIYDKFQHITNDIAF